MRVSVRPKLRPPGVAPKTETRLFLQVLHRLGSFLKFLSRKNSCSPAVKTKSVPQSMHFNILSWNSIEDALPSNHIPAPCYLRQRIALTQGCAGLCFIPLDNVRNCPWTRPATPEPRVVTDLISKPVVRSRRLPPTGMRRVVVNSGKRRLGEAAPSAVLILLFASFFSASLTRQRFLDALFLAGFQIKGVTLNLLDNVFLLHFPLEPAERIFEGLPLLQSNFRQRNYTPKLVLFGPDSYCKVL